MNETWYVMADGSVGDPRDIRPGKDGKLHHRDGRAVAYAPHGPRSRSIDPAAERAKESTKKKAEADAAEAAKAKAAEASKAPAQKKAEPKAAAKTETRETKPEEPKAGYKTRESKAD